MSPVAKALPVVSLLFGLSCFHKKKYCFPTQIKIMELLFNRSGLKMSIATLNRWLRVVEDEGYIRRIRRVRRDKKLGMIFQSTLYVISYRGYMLLHGAGVKCWDKLREIAGLAKREMTSAGKKAEKKGPAEQEYSLLNHRKRHPGAKLPWNGDRVPKKE